ncbi:ATP-dependent DNA ligase [Risungbinella massiliensis]|uniref:ATP-dependent DNA ligase n=1 Tax=Risungbinella massiliensis TaxID=1329796 RepID=UPI0005CC8C1F|nr:hypothetical protein [Risungbinella massiliensis]
MFVPLMLLQKTELHENNGYLSELKLDGMRIILSTYNDETKIYSRHQIDCTNRFPELVANSLPPNSIFDGELVVTDSKGKPDFESLMKRFSTTSKGTKKLLLSNLPVQFVIFDVIHLRGNNFTNLALLKRKEILEKVIEETETISKVRFIEGRSEDLFSLVCQQDLEGIVLKQKDSKYEIGKRSWSWQKVINYHYDDVVITGIGKGEPGVFLSFLDGKPAGIIEFPFPPEERKALWSVVDQLKIEENKDKIQLDPQIKIEVKSRGRTKNGYIRIPVFQRYLL